MVLTNVVGLIPSGEGLKSPNSEGASRLGLENLPEVASCPLSFSLARPTATHEPRPLSKSLYLRAHPMHFLCSTEGQKEDRFCALLPTLPRSRAAISMTPVIAEFWVHSVPLFPLQSPPAPH